MYSVGLDVALAEFAVQKAIEDLSASKDVFNQEDIAQYIGCSRRTVVKACNRLFESGAIERFGSPRAGYRYEVVKRGSAS